MLTQQRRWREVMWPRSSFLRLAISMIILFSSSLAFLYLRFFLNPRRSQCAFHFLYMMLQVDFETPARDDLPPFHSCLRSSKRLFALDLRMRSPNWLKSLCLQFPFKFILTFKFYELNAPTEDFWNSLYIVKKRKFSFYLYFSIPWV